MTLYRPAGLACIHCSNAAEGCEVTQTLGKKYFDDYTWRNLMCQRCKGRMYWGEPFEIAWHHRIMKSVPIAGPDRKTMNINLSLPIVDGKSVTNAQLVELTIAERIKAKIAQYLEWANKTPDMVTPEDRAFLLRIIEKERRRATL